MRWRLGIVCGSAVLLAGCIDQSRVNDTCAWSDGLSGPIDLRTRAGRGHLRRDAEVANELVVRFGDAHTRNRPDLARPYRQQCMRALTDSIIVRHGVTGAQIAAAERDRVWWADVLFVFLPVALFGIAATDFATRRICRSFDSSGRIIAAALTGVVALAIAGLTLGVANVWAFGVEGWRLHNNHVSHRAFLIPIATQTLTCAVVAVALCLSVAFFRFRRTTLGGPEHTGYAGLRIRGIPRRA